MISKNELKFIRSLKNKKYRTSEQLFLVEGEKNVLELLSADFEIKSLLATEDFIESHQQEVSDHDFYQVSPSQLSDVSSLKSNSQALAVARQKVFTADDLEMSKLVMALDHVNDPGNLGTIIRTADWFGIDQIVCSADTVEFYNPKVISATMGSFCRVRVVPVDLKAFVQDFSGATAGASMQGTALDAWKMSDPQLLVFGSESHGIRPEIMNMLDNQVHISGYGNAESLNVGVAFGIFCSRLV